MLSFVSSCLANPRSGTGTPIMKPCGINCYLYKNLYLLQRPNVCLALN